MPADIKLFKLIVKKLAGNTQYFGGFRDISAVFRQGIFNDILLLS